MGAFIIHRDAQVPAMIQTVTRDQAKGNVQQPFQFSVGLCVIHWLSSPHHQILLHRWFWWFWKAPSHFLFSFLFLSCMVIQSKHMSSPSFDRRCGKWACLSSLFNHVAIYMTLHTTARDQLHIHNISLSPALNNPMWHSTIVSASI